MFNLKKFFSKKVIMTLLVRDEVDIIEENLIFHHKQGIDGFIVTDNGSIDGTREILQKYLEKGWIYEIIDETEHTYSQAEWCHKMIKKAKDIYNAKYVISADADEFWYAKNIKKSLSLLDADKIFVPIYNMQDSGGDVWASNDRIIKKHLSENVETNLIKQDLLSKYHIFSRQIPKVIIRASKYKKIWAGNHNADMLKKRIKEKTANDIMIYHFNSRGYSHFERKVINGGSSFENNKTLSKDIGVHWRYFYEQYKTGNLKQEYAKAIGSLCMDELLNNTEITSDVRIKAFVSQLPVANVREAETLEKIKHQFPEIIDFNKMLKMIKDGASLTRFGDCEFDIAFRPQNQDDPYQKPSPELSRRLSEILNIPTSNKLIVAIPPLNSEHNNIVNFYKNLSFWEWYWLDRWRNLSSHLSQKIYGNSFFSRDSIFHEFPIEKLKTIWNEKNVCFVFSEKGRFVYDDRLFNNIKSKSEIHIPATNAFTEYERIFSECLEKTKDTLFFISAGPTASVLAVDLSKKGFQALDMGHFPNCYAEFLGEKPRPEVLPIIKKEEK